GHAGAHHHRGGHLRHLVRHRRRRIVSSISVFQHLSFYPRMPVFAYKALASNGSVTTGEIDAADRPEALRLLDKKGLQPVNLRESASAVPSAKKTTAKPGKAKAEEAPKPSAKKA